MTCTTEGLLRHRIGRVLALGMFALLTLSYMPAPLLAQLPDASNDVPDLTGIWARSRNNCTPNGVTCPFVFSEIPLKARTIGFMATWDEAAGPKYDCVPATSPSVVADPYSIQIEQQADRVIFTYEKDDIIRTVWLEGQGHPDPMPYDFTVQGYSTGRYEDGSLVVETTKFTFDPHGLDDMANVPSSTLKRVVESYSSDGNMLRANVVTEDPVFLNAPIQFAIEWVPQDEPLILPYACLPELARQPAQFLPSKYEDPDMFRFRLPDAFPPLGAPE